MNAEQIILLVGVVSGIIYSLILSNHIFGNTIRELFIMRSLKRYLKRNHYHDVNALLKTVCTSRKKDWFYPHDWIAYTLTDNIEIRFYDKYHGEYGMDICDTKGNVCIFEATIDTNNHVRIYLNEFHYIDTSLINQIMQHAVSIFNEYTQSETSVSIPHDKYLAQIEHALTELSLLQEDKAWLSQESIHRVNETFPNDLHSLQTIYESIQNKELAKKQMDESLASIKEKITLIQAEAEQNKLLTLSQREVIIAKR